MNKNSVLSFIIFLISLLSYSQEPEIEIDFEQIVPTRSIYLNGGMRATLVDGKSRTAIKIDLPENTIEWYYIFSTSEGKSGTKNLNLLAQLATQVADPSGMSSTVLSNMEIPNGSHSIDIFFTDQENIDKFLVKDDSFGRFEEGSVENTKEAVVRVDDVVSGTYYLGIKNPSSLNGVNIDIEVVAMVAYGVEIEKTEEQEKAELYARLGWTEFENGKYDKCIEYCDKANSLFLLGWVNANKGLAQLMIGKENEAVDTYVEAITLIKRQESPQYVFEEIITDIDNAMQLKPDLSKASEIKRIIQLELE